MLRLIWSTLFALLVSATIVFGQFALQAVILDRLPNPSAGGACAQASTFITRASLTGSDATNYTNLICGLVTDNIITGNLSTTACGPGGSSLLDALYIFATVNSATAVLDLCSGNFTATIVGTPTFTAYNGYTATAGSYLSSNFNPSTATSPNYTQNSAHLSVWNLTNGVASAASIIADTDPGNSENVFPKFTDMNLYARINDSSASGPFSITDPRGHILGNRSSSTARQAYQNASTTLNGGTVVSYGSVASIAVENDPIGLGGNGTASSGNQLAMASIGASMSPAQVTAFYNRLRTYMTAVGIP